MAASFWFHPSLMALAAGLLALALLAGERAGMTEALSDWGPPFSVGAEGARSPLSTISGSIITVASLVFSLTLVALTLAAGSIGARLLQRYLRKRTIQLTLGIFVATFVFALIVQSAVGTAEDGVPRLAVFLALVLSICSLFWLIFAFHDLARTIQVDNAVASLSADLQRAPDRHALGGNRRESARCRRASGPSASPCRPAATATSSSSTTTSCCGLPSRLMR